MSQFGFGATHIRATFMVYWQDAFPSLEIFYFPSHFGHHMSHLKGITHIESFVKSEMDKHYKTDRIIDVLLAGVLAMTMGESDLNEIDWHLVDHPLEIMIPVDDPE